MVILIIMCWVAHHQSHHTLSCVHQVSITRFPLRIFPLRRLAPSWWDTISLWHNCGSAVLYHAEVARLRNLHIWCLLATQSEWGRSGSRSWPVVHNQSDRNPRPQPEPNITILEQWFRHYIMRLNYIKHTNLQTYMTN